MTVTWRFLKGIGTIGGTIILVEADGHRLLFDMGRSFHPELPVFDCAIQARGISDLQRMGIAPTISGLFAGDGSKKSDAPTMVAVSHAHLDHIGLLPFLRKDIPVLLTCETMQLIDALDQVHDGPQAALLYQPVDDGVTTEFGPFRITAVAVDHDVPGACAFLIETAEVRFVYSGDVRLHGLHAKRTHHFAQAARDFAPDVLFIEGTRAEAADNTHTIAETELANRLSEVIFAQKTGVYFLFYPRHPERIEAFREAVRHSQRKLVLQAQSAYIYEQFGGSAEDLFIYGGASEKWTDTLRAWVLQKQLPVLSPLDLHGQEQRYVVELTYPRLVDWIDIEPMPEGLFIHANGNPLGSYDPAWNNLLFWIDTFGLTFRYMGSTGHGSRTDILALIEQIRPRVLMPIHSKTPELIGLPDVPRILPAYGIDYSLRDLMAAKPPTEDELLPPPLANN